ncbi:MAG: tetratricopeptide repeat protein [Alphaproteobacteria bacterium]|nr:MAG: tetratricopeptide repeat protein [Alphaproteobacteria bacterium]
MKRWDDPERLSESRRPVPRLAAEQAGEILKAVPGHPNASLLLGMARRNGGDPAAALSVLAPLAAAQPRWVAAHFELGLTLGALGRGEDAVTELRKAVELNPDLPDAWRALADHLTAMGDDAGAETARARFLKVSTRDPRLMAAAAALCDNRIPEAEALLRRHLHEHPTDIAAIRMFAEVAARLGRYHDAENLLARCLELAPGFAGARHNYAVALYRQGKPAAALPQVEQLRAAEPANPNYRSLEAAVLAGIGEYARSIDIYAEVLRRYPNQAKIWLSYGHALKTAGRSSEGIRAYRRTLELDPGLGEAWWSLANLKTFRFTAEELRQMQTQLARTDLKTEDRYHFHFALGKSLEDQQDYGSSFEHYRQGNGLRRAQIHYDPAEGREHLARARTLFTREFFAARDRQGAPDPDPIFIVGLPRAGSTLIEQILASHSQVEGTMELPDIPAMAHAVAERGRVSGLRCAFFIDKLPNNFLHLGLIHLMLPNARIIDARRHPLGCCFSAFKQHFARGQNFTYDLAELGAYYRSYVELMAHFDAVLPGRVHRVFYERMIEDTEGEVRRLLEYCRLPFEPACLRFYENERAVRTASSEQVRTPIYREGLEQWGHYEPWLGALKAALGSVLEAYPATPDFHSH